jgi:hypothetical protein
LTSPIKAAQSAFVHPLEGANIGVTEAGHRLHFQAVQRQHRQTHACAFDANAKGHLRARRRLHGIDHHRFLEKGFPAAPAARRFEHPPGTSWWPTG